ncbi:hypothetical protein EQG49_11545 [Periweissella cryptocerci]|uniref:Uncharacterized protein n=1 Tax=Periweissella cryptocerci TaxID=2506420 RepID=A0A4P6YW62_9LACO|nr:hypothetical protein [Periweissella cryptocerci]QBO37040.1 hypothetical protein EQG49_11545 [Periweissella cryptocerci]
MNKIIKSTAIVFTSLTLGLSVVPVIQPSLEVSANAGSTKAPTSIEGYKKLGYKNIKWGAISKGYNYKKGADKGYRAALIAALVDIPKAIPGWAKAVASIAAIMIAHDSKANYLYVHVTEQNLNSKTSYGAAQILAYRRRITIYKDAAHKHQIGKEYTKTFWTFVNY